MTIGLDKVSFVSIRKKGNVKECSSYNITELILHTSKVMVHFFHVRLQQYLNLEFPDVPAEFRKCQGSASAGSRGYPQDEQRQGERKRERERERERE